VTQRDLLEQLPVPVILTDLSGTVIDMNPAAERRLGLLRIGAAGRTLEAVLSHTPVPVRFETAPVEGRRGVVARFVVLEPGVEKTEPETASAA
jgi:PAS domain S-box-containing protein